MSNATEEFWQFSKYNIKYFLDIFYWWDIIHNNDYFQTDEIDYLKIAAKFLPNEPYDIQTWDKWTSLLKTKTGRSG